MSYRIIDNDTPRCQEFLRNEFGIVATDIYVCIGLERFSKINVVAGFNYFNGRSAHIHLYIKNGTRMTREFIWFVFYYAFVQAGLELLIAMMPERKPLSDKFGFIERYRIEGAHPEGAVIMRTLKKNDCRFITGRYAKVKP